MTTFSYLLYHADFKISSLETFSYHSDFHVFDGKCAPSKISNFIPYLPREGPPDLNITLHWVKFHLKPQRVHLQLSNWYNFLIWLFKSPDEQQATVDQHQIWKNVVLIILLLIVITNNYGSYINFVAMVLVTKLVTIIAMVMWHQMVKLKVVVPVTPKMISRVMVMMIKRPSTNLENCYVWSWTSNSALAKTRLSF